MDDPASICIGLVGPCKSGKSVLKQKLLEHGYCVKHIAQEHSFVKDMWKKISNPDILVYLDVSYETTLKRSSLTWKEKDFQVQIDRLKHAREHADIIIQTDDLTPDEILSIVIEHLA